MKKRVKERLVTIYEELEVGVDSRKRLKDLARELYDMADDADGDEDDGMLAIGLDIGGVKVSVFTNYEYSEIEEGLDCVTTIQFEDSLETLKEKFKEKPIVLVNCTMGEVTLMADLKTVVQTLPVNRLEPLVTRKAQKDILGIEVYVTEGENILNLPKEEGGVIYIVPVEVAAVCKGRDDLVYPIHPVRGRGGKIIGYLGLAKF